MSEIRDLCRKAYQERIAALDINVEFKRALKTHERVPQFIDNLATEFLNINHSVKRETIEKAVHDMTDFFVIGLQEKQKFQVMSDVAKMTIKKREDAKEEFRREAEALERKGTDYVTQNKDGETSHQVTEIDDYFV